MGALNIGKYTYGRPDRRGDGNTVNIGKFCSIAGGVAVDGGFQHNIKFISTYPFPTCFPDCGHLTGHVVCRGDINIGNDVWIGEQVMIMAGVTIGEGAVIGFRSVVTKDVEPYTIVAGSPAKFIRKRFTDTEIEMLLNIKWWDWPQEHIKNAAQYLMSADTVALGNYYLLNIKP